MKKYLAGILCASLAALTILTSCGFEDTKAKDDADVNGTEAEGEAVLPELPEEEEDKVEIFEYKTSGSEATLLRYNGNDEEVVIEEKVTIMKKKKKKFKKIDTITNEDGTVEKVEEIVEQIVEVPEEFTVTEIEECAFMGNETVKKVIIPDSVKEIGEAAFQGCAALEEVKLPAGLEAISERLFYGSALTTLEIPAAVKSVGLFAFGDYFEQTPWYNAQTADSVIVGDGVLLKYNGGAANVTYGEEVKAIAYYAFLDKSVNEVTVTKALASVDSLAFYRSSGKVLVPKDHPKRMEFRQNGISVDTY